MSHFSVLVVGDDVEGQLASFQENNMGDCPKEYLSFQDKEDEFVEEYKNEGTEQVMLLEYKREWFFPFSNELKNQLLALLHKERKDLNIPDIESTEQERIIREFRDSLEKSGRLVKEERPFRVIYPSFEEFCADWHGHKERNPEKNRYGYWANNNAKWDWYLIGGRWTGYFRMKLGFTGVVGRPGIQTSQAPYGWADQAPKGEIDFIGMRKDAAIKASEKYDLFEQVTADLLIPLRWEEVRNNYTKEGIDNARKEYNSYPWVQAIRKAGIMPWDAEALEYFFVGKGGREAFVKNAYDKAISTFAIVKDGEWHERGKMGFFGFVSDENEDWESSFQKLFDSIPDDTLLTIVDCHI